MNSRFQTKCFLASAAMHALLIVIVCIAPAFLPEKPQLNSPAVTVISSQVLDKLLQEAERPPAPAPAPTAPVVTPVAPVAPAAPAVVAPVPVAKPAEPVRAVEPPPPPKPVEPPKAVVKTPPPIPKAPKDLPKKEIVKETVKEPAPKTTKTETRPLAISAKGKEAPPKKDAKKAKEPEHEVPVHSDKAAKTAKAAPAPPATPAKSTIKIADTKNLVSRKSEAEAKAKQQAEAEDRAQAMAAAKAAQQAHLQHAARIKSILGGVQGGLSSPVDINIDAGGGPNAAAFLDYGQMMVRIYEQAWLVPPNLNESVSVVGVTVTVARNGRVLDCQVIKPCGNSSVDKSVRETLQKVLQFEPFPASFRESQRTFNIDFNLKAKRTTG